MTSMGCILLRVDLGVSHRCDERFRFAVVTLGNEQDVRLLDLPFVE